MIGHLHVLLGGVLIKVISVGFLIIQVTHPVMASQFVVPTSSPFH